ncbi:MAG: tripartite tricarboxylate transporter permease, partial [Firmicutes bacterium]|nr:tripartite tricarboxylate transporter permease [Bacillota bacterium]
MLLGAFVEIFTTNLFLYSLLGVVAGMVIGVLPGLSATMGVAILTPLTFWLEPAQGLAVLLGIYNSAIWAGGVSAILINTPGTPASIAQTFDGYHIVKEGKIGLALSMNTIYSVVGGLFGSFVLTVAAFPVARFALRFGPPEMFALA